MSTDVPGRIESVLVVDLAVMPSGVEHMSPDASFGARIAVDLAVMPSGVEHYGMSVGRFTA